MSLLLLLRSAGGVPAVLADFTQTDASDTLSSQALAQVSAALTRTDAADLLTASSAVLVAGSLSAVDAPDALTSTSGAVVLSSAALVDAADSLAAVASSDVAASLAATDERDELSATAAEEWQGHKRGWRTSAVWPWAERPMAGVVPFATSAALDAVDEDDRLVARARTRVWSATEPVAPHSVQLVRSGMGQLIRSKPTEPPRPLIRSGRRLFRSTT